MEIALGWLVLSVLVAVLAGSRGRSTVGFFLLSLFLSPLIGLLVLLVVRNLAAEGRERQFRQQDQQRQASALDAVAQLSRASVADEIKKLAELRVGGVLTDEEFAQQKARLLASTEALAGHAPITCARCGASAEANAATCPGCGGKFVRVS